MVLSEIKSVLGYIYGSMRGVLDMTMLRRARCFALIPVLTMLAVSASAQELTSDVDKSCVGLPIDLTATGFTSAEKGTIDWFTSVDEGKTWKPEGSMDFIGEGACSITLEMPDVVANAMFKAELRGTDQVCSTTVEISTDCPPQCHTTTTGVYYMGTDFTPKDSLNRGARIPNDVEHHFDDAGIGFKEGSASQGGAGGYEIKQDFGYRPGNLPDTTDNYYYVMDGAKTGAQFDLIFPISNVGKSYRYTMLFYVVYPEDCMPNIQTAAKIKVQTGQGMQSSDALEMSVYDDKTGKLVFTEMKNGGNTETWIEFGDTLSNYIRTNKGVTGNTAGKDSVKAFRFEVTFYGRFPNDPNGLPDFKFYPRFEQFNAGTYCPQGDNSCQGATPCDPIVAVDYISAEVENVCLNLNPVCIGDTAIANAAGFAKDAQYRWEMFDKDIKQWVTEKYVRKDTVVDTLFYSSPFNGKSQMQICVKNQGKTSYRVYDAGQPDHSVFEFIIAGRSCKPKAVGRVDGKTNVCVADGATVQYKVPEDQIDSNPNVKYNWFLRDSVNKKDYNLITDSLRSTIKGDSIFGIDSVKVYSINRYGDSIVVTFNKNMKEYKEGDIKLGVYPSADAIGDTLLVDLTLKEKPAVSLKLLGNYFDSGTSETDKELCPADKFQKIVANIASPNGYPANKYTFVWSGASGKTDTATVDIETVADRCDPTKEKSMEIGVTVSKDGCETYTANTYKVRPSVGPSINCESIAEEDRVIYLDPTQSDTLVKIPFPEFAADCDPNPILIIELEGKRTSVIDTFYRQELYVNDTTKKDTGLYIRLKSDTIRTTYTVMDGCDSARTCGIVFIVKDNTAPDIDCDSLVSYNYEGYKGKTHIETKLSYFASCEAVPGKHESLPVLVAPKLEDRNGSDGVIEGTYLGRFNTLDGGEPNIETNMSDFNKKIKLNAVYPPGNNYILWGFYDFDGNVSYCIQLVRVIDDNVPKVSNCPPDSYIGEIGMNEGECGLSLDTFLASIGNRIPYAKDVCSSTEELTPRYFFREVREEGMETWTEILDFKALVFQNDGTKYEIAWRFYKAEANGQTVDSTVYGECIQSFTLKDKEGPKGYCDDLPDHNVRVNQHTLDQSITYKYASAKNPAPGSANVVGVIYSLAGEFSIPLPKDNCGGDVAIEIEIADPGKKDGDVSNKKLNGTGDENSIALLVEELNRYAFQIGLTHVIYTFTDERGNKTICDQGITVSSKYAPIVNCGNVKDMSLLSEGTCKVNLDLKLSDVPVATFPYFLEIRDNKTGNPYNPSEYGNYPVNPKSGDQAGPKGYPSKVVRQTNVDSITLKPTSLTKTYVLDNALKPGNKVDIKIVNNYDAAGNLLNSVVHDSIGIHLSNFNQLPEDLTNDFPTGTHLVTWFFDNGFGDIDSCVSKIVVKDTTSPVFDCSSLDTIKAPIAQVSVCETAVEIDIPEAQDFCNPSYIAKGVGTRSDRLPLDAEYPAGITTITWTFTSPYSASAKVCKQTVLVQSVTPPVFNCGDIEDINVYTKLDSCDVTANMVDFDEYFARDYCTNDTVPGVKSREDRRTFNDNYPLGETKIKWLFVSPYSLDSTACFQKVIVHDTTLPSDWKCDLIEPRVINVEISTSDAFVLVDDVVKSGLSLDGNINLFKDPCGEVLVDSERSDGKALTDNYPLGETTITWTYKDHAGNVMYCDQTVIVGDMSAGEMKCPKDLDGKTFGCYSGLDIKPYETFEDFKLVGGTWDKDEALLDSFWHEDEKIGDPCDMGVKRVYWIRNIRGLKTSCKQEFRVHDEIAPVFKTVPRDTVMTCDDYEIPEPEELEAEDNCAGVMKVKAIVTNFRDMDPSSCGYYNYKIEYKWVAVDDCGNKDSVLKYIYIEDKEPPVVNWDGFSEDFYNGTVLAKMDGACKFSAPDLASRLKDKVSDNCNDVNYIKIVQTPAPGTPLKETTKVELSIFDNCNNSLDTSFVIKVLKRKTIVSVEAVDKSVCVTDGLDLESQTLRELSGTIEYFEYGGVTEERSQLFIDYYRDSISEGNLIYSDNPETYGERFGEQHKKLLDIVSHKQSGRYVFVAMDTVAYCSDTASAYFDFVERPRISLYADTVALCEGDSIAITGPNSFFHKYGVCIDERGGVVDSTAWLLDDSLYHAHQPVPGGYRTLKFYAKNECGESDSKNSLFAFCEMLKATTEDSLLAAGSEENLKLWREDKLYSNDSIVLDVHTRYDADKFILTTLPTDKPRVVRGDGASLIVKTNYKPKTYYWYRVNGKSDGMYCFDAFSVDGEVDDDCVDSDDSKDELLGVTIDGFDVDANKFALASVSDTADYYVLITDSVCPAAQSNVVEIAVLDELPSAITPYTIDNLNDVFMKGYFVMIFNRYGQKVFEGEDGWDGKIDGVLVDPGVYFYDTRLKDGSVVSGTIEVVKIK